MIFLAPLAGIIGAAIAVPALLALYLLRLRRRPLRISSTLLWEQAAQDLQVNVPLRMLRWSWLLLLHLLALACFLLALARPAVGEGGAVGAQVVIIIDRSASMSAADVPVGPGEEPRTRLEAAKRQANELIASIGRGGAGSQRPRCMIVAMAASPRALTAFTPDLRTLRDAVDAIEPSDQPDDLPATLELIEAVTADHSDSGDAPARPTVYLFTDGVVEPPTDRQRGGINPIVSLVPAQSPGSPAQPIDNIGFTAVSARFDADDPGLIRVFARLVNAGAAPVILTVRCTIDGQLPPDGISSVTVPAATSIADAAFSGESAAVFTLRTQPGPQPRTIVVSISRPDALASDDAAGLVLPPVWRPRILLVAPDAEVPGAAPTPDVFLLQALEATEPASLAVVPAAAIRPVVVVPGAAIPPSPWAASDIVVFDRVAPPEGRLPPVPTISFGASLPIAGLALAAAQSPGTTARALAWRKDHPALRYVGLDTLLIAPAASIQPPPADAAEASPTAFTSLVDGTTGPLIAELSERNPAGGSTPRLLIAFDLARSNWGPDISFPLFVGNAVEYLAAAGKSAPGSAISLSTTDRLAVSVPAGAAAIAASGAQQIEFLLPGDAAAERQVQIGPLERVGVYGLRTTDGRPVAPAAAVVNLASERESRLLRRLDARTAAPEFQAGSQAGPREVWHWFILVALGLLTVEWFVYAWRMRG